MWMLIGVFVSTFVTVLGLGLALAWTFQAKAELKSWKEKYERTIEAQNHTAWARNKEMIVY